MLFAVLIRSIDLIFSFGLLMDLPQEILDAFIDEIARTMRQQESLHTLTACSLVNRSMNHRCRKHLFFSIETSPRKKRTRMDSKEYPKIMLLRKILDNNPTLSRYFRRLRIDLGINGVEAANLTQHIPHILQHLSHNPLEAVEISAKGFSQIKFSSLPASLQRSLFGLQNGSTLNTLTLCNLTSVPVSFVTGFPNLLHLYLTGVSLIKDELLLPTKKPFHDASGDWGAHPRGGGQPMLPTFSLYTLNVNRFLGLFATSFLELKALSGLKKITANISGVSDACAFAQIIGSAANSLEVLDLNVTSNRMAFPFSFALPLDAGLFPSLRAVTFRLHLAPHCRWIADHDSVILKSPSVTSNLSSVQLILTQYNDVLDNVVAPTFMIDDAAGWSSLDDALDSRNFVGLSTVDLVVNLLTHSTNESFRAMVKRRTEQGIYSALPRLSASSSIKVTKRVSFQVL
ncbi:hypothetical protein M413DRAFT_21938 [Hebeloma cylindrosporum]|uniref:F-box domain-containing protein n=1 Tax=Hebeloma cylindrosporum TaxID=76867 RepID=A0A0C3CM85_HEBCY|nr:hypothetical protein M413DRAFT_21938 [Hebeloma cylindrosporum h7]